MTLDKEFVNIPILNWTDHAYFIGILDTGKYAAANYKSPYFCIIGETVVEVVEKAEETLKQYKNYQKTGKFE